MKVFVFLTVLACAFWFGLQAIKQLTRPMQWQGYFYANGDLDNPLYSPIFSSKDACLDWGKAKKEERLNNSDIFECGLNCTKEQKSLLPSCEETVRE